MEVANAEVVSTEILTRRIAHSNVTAILGARGKCFVDLKHQFIWKGLASPAGFEPALPP
jgi:hypothetical protein